MGQLVKKLQISWKIMGKKMSILFITSRNIINTCGELRLIKNRATCLQEEYKKSTEFVVCRSKKCARKAQEEMGAGSILIKFLYAEKNPFSVLHNFKLLKKTIFQRLKENQYELIILSGTLVLSLAKKIKKKYPDAKIIIDVHGALEELVEFKSKGVFKNFTRAIIFKVFNKIFMSFIIAKH